MTKPPARKFRCAIYTRKSSEEGLEQEFNSLDAQREACAAYIASQKPEGWVRLTSRYDDGGVSGGTLDRPALSQLLADIERGLVDVVVVYKIDRLSRALMDFARLVEIFDRHNVTFVSVTQSFNTTTSMGRLTLNILLSFAQFEREVIGERIRDKVAASRKRGMWMGGVVPLGYRVHDRKLVIDEQEAAKVRMIFERFLQLGSVAALARSIADDGLRSRRGRLLNKAAIYKLLGNKIYVGEAVHKGTAYPGEHKPIIDRNVWDKVRSILQQSPRARACRTRAATPALLKGLLYGPTGRSMSPTHTRRGNKLYRYYISQSVLKHGPEACPVRRLPAAEIEAAVVDQLRVMLRSPEIIAATWRAARSEIKGLSENDVREALERLDPIWDAPLSRRASSSSWWRGSMLVSMASTYTSGPKASHTPSLNCPASLYVGGRLHERFRGPRCCSRSGSLCHPQARGAKAGLGAGRNGSSSRSAARGQRDGKGPRPSIPLAQAAGDGRLRDHRGVGCGREDQPILREPNTAVDATGARHHRGDTRWAACAGTNASEHHEAFSGPVE
jgi:site-specific DNA recombinase